MKIQTFSIVAGSALCNAKCPFCVSKMTPTQGVEKKEPQVNWRNFEIACKLARQNQVSTAMITSKGEPTLFPAQVDRYLDYLDRFQFPLIELQTNGIPIMERPNSFENHLDYWYEKGLTTIAISVVHYDAGMNKKIYTPHSKKTLKYEDLFERLHDKGFSIRLSLVMLETYIDRVEEVLAMLDYCRANKIEQLTLRPVRRPGQSEDLEAFKWVSANSPSDGNIEAIQNYFDSNATLLMDLIHGGRVYDFKGQNLCLTDCLTLSPKEPGLRQLIFFPDGHIRYDWQYSGAILL